MFCKFCNQEVDPVVHIIKCSQCGKEAHGVEDHYYECAGCGRKFSQVIPAIPAREGEEEIKVEREVPVSEVREPQIGERAGKSAPREERKSKDQ